MQLHEIGDTKLNLKFQKSGKFELTSFTINEIVYVIQIENKPLEDNISRTLKGKKCAEVSFFINMEDDEKAFSTNDIFDLPVRIYSIVYNSLVEKFNQYDAFYFSAERRHSSTDEQYQSKIRIYSFFADKIHKRTAYVYLYEWHDSYSHEWVISKLKLDDTKFIREEYEARLKLIGKPYTSIWHMINKMQE